MPISDGVKACVALAWICALGMVACVVLQSPWIFAFGFGLIYAMCSVARTFALAGQGNKEDDAEAFEMQPLDSGPLKIRGDMTLGELLNKY